MEDVTASKDQMRDLHKTISKVTEDTEELRFNTAIASMMEFMNATKKWDNKPRAALEPFLLLLAPYAPHIAEECWSRCGHSDTLTYEGWPQLDESLLVQDEITLPVQVCAYFLLLLSSYIHSSLGVECQRLYSRVCLLCSALAWMNVSPSG